MLTIVAALSGLAPDCPARSTGAPEKIWVFFADKGFKSSAEIETAIVGLAAAYDQRAVERRRARRTLPGLFDVADLPVAARYRDAVSATGAKIHIESPWLNAVSVRATPEQARAISRLPFVRGTEPVRAARRSLSAGVRPGPVTTPGAGDDFYGLASDQLNQINLVALHGQGFTGAGLRIGVLDTGFKRTHSAFNQPGHALHVVAERDFVENDNNTAPEPGDDPDQHVHGTLVLGCLAAYKPNELVAGAYDASYILCKTEDITSETPAEEDNYIAALQFIETHGGDMATASLVYNDWYTYSQLNGTTCLATIAVNIATANGLYCVNAAGNGGNDSDPMIGHLGGTPTDAFQVLTIGSVNSAGATSWFSADGPTADGRIKPELMARGEDTKTIDPSDDNGYTGASGTSVATPLAASAVACLVQARPWWSVDRLRFNLLRTASDFVANGAPDPFIVRGYGIIHAGLALLSDCYPNCDLSTASPALNVNDFTCFLNAYAAGSPGANCDRSTVAPVLNVNDFTCFLNQYAVGCGL